MVQAEIAVLRFGLGAKPGELSEAAHDPRGWLRAQITGAAPLSGSPPLRTLPAYSARCWRRVHSGRSRNAKPRPPISRTESGPRRLPAALPRAGSGARAKRGAHHAAVRGRLVYFWSNHFAVSADKGAVYGVAGALENEAIRPHVGGRFLDLLTAVEHHPAMIAFLDNQYSVGQESPLAALAARRVARPRETRIRHQ